MYPQLSSAIPRSAARSVQPVEREIQFEHVDPSLSNEAPQSLALVRLDQRLNLCEFKMPGASHASGLVLPSRRTHLGIETAGRCGHKIDRYRLLVVRVSIA